MKTLAYRRTGTPSKTPLLLLHALPLDSTMWDQVREHLDLDVLTVDAPGFGDSVPGEELAEGRPEISTYVEALKATLDSLGIERVAIGGLSMGGSVAAQFTGSYPAMIAGLAIMDSNIQADDADLVAFREGVAAMAEAGNGYDTVKEWTTLMVSPEASEEVRASLDARFRALPDAALAWIQRAMSTRPDSTDAVELVEGPVYLVRGTDDATCSLESLMHIALKAKHPRIIEIDDAGHFTADEKPAELAAVLAEFYAAAVAQ